MKIWSEEAASSGVADHRLFHCIIGEGIGFNLIFYPLARLPACRGTGTALLIRPSPHPMGAEGIVGGGAGAPVTWHADVGDRLSQALGRGRRRVRRGPDFTPSRVQGLEPRRGVSSASNARRAIVAAMAALDAALGVGHQAEAFPTSFTCRRCRGPSR